MLRVRPFANALAVLAAAGYLLCGILAAFAPDLYHGIARTWVHGMDVAVLFPAGMTTTLGSFLLGLVTFTAAGWVAGAALATLYNRFAGVTSPDALAS